MGTALITGVHGFTGRYLAQELRSAGYTVVGLCQDKPEKNELSLVFQHNMLERSGLDEIILNVKPDVIIHLAAVAFVAHGDVDAIYRTNIVGTRNLLEAVVKSRTQPRSILLVSSANVYGNVEAVSIDETTPTAPANDYAVSKLAMEHMARLWCGQLPITVVRPFNYTGVGQSQKFLLPKIVAHFRRKAAVLELGNLDVLRDFSDVRAVVRSYRLLLEAEQAGQLFNVCSGQGHSLQEVLQMMREIGGFSPEIRVNPAFVRANEVHSLIGSRAKLDAVIGLQPEHSLEETLQWMYQEALEVGIRDVPRG